MKSLAKIVAMGLVMSSVPVMGAWAEDLVVTDRNLANQDNKTVMNKWDWTSDYKYHQHAYTVGKDNHVNNTMDYHDVTIVMKNTDADPAVVNGYNDPSLVDSWKDKWSANALINEYGHHFSADGNVFIRNDVIAPKSTNAVYTYAGDKEVAIDFSNAHSVVVIANGNNKSGSQALTAKNGGSIAIKTNEIDGFTKIIGDVDLKRFSTPAGTLSMDLNNSKSYWYGNEKSVGNLQLTIRKGAEWIYTTGIPWNGGEIYTTGKSISKVTLKDGGIINLRNADVQKKFTEVNNDEALRSGEDFGYLHMYDNYDHRYVQIGTLKGTDGIFKVDLQYNDDSKSPVYLPPYDNPNVGESSDYIFVKQGSGTYDVQFVADEANLDAMGKDSKLYFANDKSGGVTFKSSTVKALAPKTSAANLYDYKYAVKNEANGNAKDWFIALDQGDANENIPAAFKAMQAGYALGTEMDRFNKRMGESRYLEGDSGLWVRYRHARTGWENSFKTNSNMFQVGFDKLKLEKDGKHYRGGAVDYTDANTSLLGLKGNGEHERYALSLYDTWIGDKGHYLDLVLRGGRTSNDLDVTTRNQEIIKGKYHQNFGSISGEWGRKLANDNGWYVEPQAQLQIARVGSADYRTNYGVKVEQDAATSVIARAGFRLGRDFSDKGNFYMKADWLHEFCGDQNIRVSAADGSEQSSFNGQDSWWDLGLGADFSLGKDTYLYCDFERTLGGNYNRTWQANVGLRYAF